MLIDWFTVTAQVVNFLILVALLKHFLYGPILEAMDRRSERVRSRLEAADSKRREAEERQNALKERQREWEQQRDEVMSRAEREAEERRKDLAEQARARVKSLEDQWIESLERDKEAFVAQLRESGVRHVYGVARRCLADLAAVELEARLVDTFIARVTDLDEEQTRPMCEAIAETARPLIVMSAFELSPGMRRKVTRTLHDTLADEAEVDYQTRPDLITGIELKMEGGKVAWNVCEYLKDLEESAMQAIEEYVRRRNGKDEREARSAEHRA